MHLFSSIWDDCLFGKLQLLTELFHVVFEVFSPGAWSFRTQRESFSLYLVWQLQPMTASVWTVIRIKTMMYNKQWLKSLNVLMRDVSWKGAASPLKSGCDAVCLWPLLVWSGLYAIEAALLKKEILNWSLHCTKKCKEKGRICISNIVDAISLDMLLLLVLFCKPKFKPEEFLHINVLSIAVAHPSPFCFWITKIGLRYESYSG